MLELTVVSSLYKSRNSHGMVQRCCCLQAACPTALARAVAAATAAC